MKREVYKLLQSIKPYMPGYKINYKPSFDLDELQSRRNANSKFWEELEAKYGRKSQPSEHSSGSPVSTDRQGSQDG